MKLLALLVQPQQHMFYGDMREIFDGGISQQLFTSEGKHIIEIAVRWGRRATIIHLERKVINSIKLSAWASDHNEPISVLLS